MLVIAAVLHASAELAGSLRARIRDMAGVHAPTGTSDGDVVAVLVPIVTWSGVLCLVIAAGLAVVEVRRRRQHLAALRRRPPLVVRTPVDPSTRGPSGWTV